MKDDKPNRSEAREAVRELTATIAQVERQLAAMDAGAAGVFSDDPAAMFEALFGKKKVDR